MTTKPKIKITDNSALRAQIDALYTAAPQVTLAKWSLQTAKRILERVNQNVVQEDAAFNSAALTAVNKGFAMNEAWQRGEKRMHDVRQAGFAVHAFARNCHDPAMQAALRCAGQAIGSGHMREHAMVASDYAVKAVGAFTGDDLAAITAEREIQLQTLQDYLQSLTEKAPPN